MFSGLPYGRPSVDRRLTPILHDAIPLYLVEEFK